MAEPLQTQELTVKGDSVERIYGNFRAQRYLVNRRYQRKLVWTLDEKRSFIDSIAKGYPVPIVLLAEVRAADRTVFEIIDGMQRLNAIMAFLENEYPVDGAYFDLNTMAATKALLDAGHLEQKEPKLPRDLCVAIASYPAPFSIYESSQEQEVDEVFRRINSGGRKLSRQELRIAGSTGHFSQVVRTIASKVRGDVSAADTLLLNDMNKISIGSKELPYGIDVDSVFWIHEGILTKEQTRESRDEELIADILAYILLDPKPPSRSEFLDDYFGFEDGEPAKRRLEDIERAVQKNTADVITLDFQRALDGVRLALSSARQTFGKLLFGGKTARAPRYFQAIFLAFYRLIVIEHLEISDHPRLVTLMTGLGKSVHITEGGRWSASDRGKAINSVVGMIKEAFQPAKAYDPARIRWITQLENILTQSYTEQAAYDFKQGFLRLDGANQFDDISFEKILKTLVGIVNLNRGTTGYVLIGIAEKKADAQRIQDLFGDSPRIFERFYITGVEHEATAMGKDLDQLFQLIMDKIKQAPISEPLRDYVSRNVKLVRYYEKSVVIIETRAQEEPSHYAGKYLVRRGNALDEIPPEKYGELFRRFQRGQ
jgi:RNAse (barnase) inhibitor barstar